MLEEAVRPYLAAMMLRDPKQRGTVKEAARRRSKDLRCSKGGRQVLKLPALQTFAASLKTSALHEVTSTTSVEISDCLNMGRQQNTNIAHLRPQQHNFQARTLRWLCFFSFSFFWVTRMVRQPLFQGCIVP